jgi:hypothetical protein
MRPDGTIDNSCLQSREVWTGTTYALAAGMILEALATPIEALATPIGTELSKKIKGFVPSVDTSSSLNSSLENTNLNHSTGFEVPLLLHYREDEKGKPNPNPEMRGREGERAGESKGEEREEMKERKGGEKGGKGGDKGGEKGASNEENLALRNELLNMAFQTAQGVHDAVRTLH